MIQDIQNDIIRLIIDSDRRQATNLICDWAENHDFRSAICDVMAPALMRLGDLWENKKITLAHGFLAGKVAEDVLEKAAIELASSAIPAKGPVVLGNIEDDYHALGRKLVCVFLKTNGWQVIDLGNDVLAEEFVRTAIEADAKVIGVSAMMHSTAVNIALVRKELDNRGLTGRVKLAVGGAIFNLRPSLIHEVGGDGSCENAMEASSLMDKLWAEAGRN